MADVPRGRSGFHRLRGRVCAVRIPCILAVRRSRCGYLLVLHLHGSSDGMNVLTSSEELDALPKWTLIRATQAEAPEVGHYFERFLAGWLHLTRSDPEEGEGTVKSRDVLKWYGSGSITVLWEPAK